MRQVHLARYHRPAALRFQCRVETERAMLDRGEAKRARPATGVSEVYGPNIETAIPKRRFQIGDFSAVILGEVTSRDQRTYEYILALVPDGETEPVLYITAEKVVADAAPEKVTVVRVIADGGERILGPDQRWCDLDLFGEDALAMVQKVMGLGEEEPRRLL